MVKGKTMTIYNICKNCYSSFKKRPDSKGIYCSNECRILIQSQERAERNKRKGLAMRETYNLSPKRCIQCQEIFSYENRSKKFCSHACSANYYAPNRGPMSEEQKEKLRQRASDYYTKNPPSKKLFQCICCICQNAFEHTKWKKTCSPECFSIHRANVARSNTKLPSLKRSKDEIQLFELCKNSYPNIRHNEIIADGWDADIIFDDYKIAVLWNGPWHYQQMPLSNHSLLQVQNRDKIKTKLFESLGWTVLVFEDRHYTPASALVKIQEYIKWSQAEVPPLSHTVL